MKIGNFFDRFCLIFLRGNNLNKADFKVFKLSGLIFLQAILVGIVFIPLHYKAGGFKLLLYSFIVSGAGVISLLLFRYSRHRNFSKLLFITICNLAIYYNEDIRRLPRHRGRVRPSAWRLITNRGHLAFRRRATSRGR